MSVENDPGFWKQAADWMWAVLALPIATLWKKADGALQKDDFKSYMEEAKAERKEMRENVIKLFDKIDEIKEDVNEKTQRLTHAIYEQRK